MENNKSHLEWWKDQTSKTEEGVLKETNSSIDDHSGWRLSEMQKDWSAQYRKGLVSGINVLAQEHRNEGIATIAVTYAELLGIPINSLVEEIERRTKFLKKPSKKQKSKR